MSVEPAFTHDSSSAHNYNSDSNTELESNFFPNFLKLLQSTSLCNLLQSHTKILIVDSRVPFEICLKSLSNYNRNFSFVYDAQKNKVIGYIDELSIIKFVKNSNAYINLSCREFLSVIEAQTIHKLADDVTAFDGFNFIRENVSNRLFVWSTERDAPIGYVTPSCYLFYLVKNLRGKYDLFDLPLSCLRNNIDFNTISHNKSLAEVLDLLILKDNVCVTDDTGRIIGIITRLKITFYCLDLFKNESPLDFSTRVSNILDQMDSQFYNKIQPLHVESGIPIRKAIVSLLMSNDRVLVYTNENGLDLMVTIWDMIQFLVVN